MRSREEIFARLVEAAALLYKDNIPSALKNSLRREITELATALELGELYPEYAPPVSEGTLEYNVRRWVLECSVVEKDVKYLLENLIEINPVETRVITKEDLEREKKCKKEAGEG